MQIPRRPAISPRMTETAELPMRVAVVPVTAFEQNCSLLWCTKTMRGALVDPGGDLPRLKQALAKAGVTLEKILVTHGHMDHCGQAGVLAKEMGVPIEGRKDWGHVAILDHKDNPKHPVTWRVDGQLGVGPAPSVRDGIEECRDVGIRRSGRAVRRACHRRLLHVVHPR